ncbi:MAG: 1-(5-phosphoribosyl)-5-[(5-phosphoribosylamino)methylideneamino]imidazole-4-carboxamide isomerase, partial [Abditibacteriaceae bacterium]
MEIIPAIDIRNGKCVRLYQGRYDEETIYADDPVDMAKRWADEGATRLHLVDLDGARAGHPVNLDVIERIGKAISIPMQLGGGLREKVDIQKVLSVGVSRCILGTAAAKKSEWAQQMFAEFGDAIILGIDAKNGIVAVSGWEETSEIPAVDFARNMQDKGCARIIFTDIARDGTLAGPNEEAMREMCKAVEIPVIASGGFHKAT